MPAKNFTANETLDALEATIGCLDKRGLVSPQRLAALKSLVEDIRGREPIASRTAKRELERRINDLIRTKTPAGAYNQGGLVGLAQELLGRWPTVKQALDLMDEEHAKRHQGATEDV